MFKNYKNFMFIYDHITNVMKDICKPFFIGYISPFWNWTMVHKALCEETFKISLKIGYSTLEYQTFQSFLSI